MQYVTNAIFNNLSLNGKKGILLEAIRAYQMRIPLPRKWL